MSFNRCGMVLVALLAILSACGTETQQVQVQAKPEPRKMQVGESPTMVTAYERAMHRANLTRWNRAVYDAHAGGIVAAQRLAEREARSRPRTVTASRSATNPSSVNGFLACTQGHESGGSGTALDGNYGAVNPSGKYRGAYQFSRSTWDSTARHAGWSELVGVDPAQASPADQDRMAAHLYQWQGNDPWQDRC